jgi:hypothetical protein
LQLSLQEKLFLATKKVVAKNTVSLLKILFATTLIVAGTAVAKSFSNDFGCCARLHVLATSCIVAKKHFVAILLIVLATKNIVAK